MPQVSVTRTYLELRTPEQLRASRTRPAGASLESVEHCPPPLFRWLYTTVGGPWHWRDRLPWDDATIEAHFANPATLLRVLRLDGAIAGYYELNRDGDGAVEIVHFGLVPEFIGKGLGGWFLAEAVGDAWTIGATRVWLHTCTLDGEAALPNYLARGFTAYKSEQYLAEVPVEA